ncbi:hypothetical protein FPQ18DRAFT_311451 [Pyronema domesticum]|nr:hypothetical protein FPQ18DRAFT_311451 [Pyronema domesticum]
MLKSEEGEGGKSGEEGGDKGGRGEKERTGRGVVMDRPKPITKAMNRTLEKTPQSRRWNPGLRVEIGHRLFRDQQPPLPPRLQQLSREKLNGLSRTKPSRLAREPPQMPSRESAKHPRRTPTEPQTPTLAQYRRWMAGIEDEEQPCQIN